MLSLSLCQPHCTHLHPMEYHKSCGDSPLPALTSPPPGLPTEPHSQPFPRRSFHARWYPSISFVSHPQQPVSPPCYTPCRSRMMRCQPPPQSDPTPQVSLSYPHPAQMNCQIYRSPYRRCQAASPFR